MKKYILIALAAVVIVSLVAINLLAESDKPQTTKGSHDISVVAAENQYGSIAKLIGGCNVKVTN
ncbi:ABC transporter substrate-binding protein, partial [Francisella tularensis subsp. holarctica]|nr:ABC transporter substrate-binding protein [Francisella tularensis subsp. holarctica]